ncbi:DUF4365 domain-containing protein [Pseudomonas oryzihabitans]|uniref:DUF4365 domain-containing protein n=1 Tax=Pseudomonas oryzihabitans TaxID=47885 RepID=A0AAJ2BJ70_9PSED|nr:DUF4365 domain-containing protein [Pseudomonas psychrotolerans]MDR6233597.1 hypothetical protein [Pseudomonas psychrotolerans]
MKYPSKTAIGNAGEFFFAYQISHILGWPCRLFDIDIGIDAQVEVLDENYNSTGRFVAFQVKTSAEEEIQPFWYVSKKQLNYWQDMDIPVFVALVSLKQQTIYLHQINKKSHYHTTKKDLARINFDFTQGKFSELSKKLIKNAAEESVMLVIKEHLSEAETKTKEIISTIEKMENHPDPPYLIEIMNNRGSAYEDLLRAKTLSINYNVGAQQCEHAEEALEEALNNLRNFMKKWKMNLDWDDKSYGNGEIQKFIDET